MQSFSQKLLRWFDHNGRKDLPWQQPPTAYRVWVSEVMLQQTQVATVIPYFERFMARFADVHALAAAPTDEVMAYWAGLGYYARARNLHRCAQQVVSDYGGEFPSSIAALQSLPGIGRSTAGAIVALAFARRGVILDGNVRRVLSRYAAIDGWAGRSDVQRRLWALAESLTPQNHSAGYTQAIMDLGALVCLPTRPRCKQCPLAADCRAHLTNRVSQYPHKKPKKQLPTKTTRLLICETNGTVLLEKRPPAGIWGGLWSLPEMPPTLSVASMTAQLARQYGITATTATVGKTFKHSFTHYHLLIEPWHINITATASRIAEPQLAWVGRQQLGDFGLPRPVQRLLMDEGADDTQRALSQQT